jgi:hypothetical protein
VICTGRGLLLPKYRWGSGVNYKAVGLIVPETLLATADEVIQ